MVFAIAGAVYVLAGSINLTPIPPFTSALRAGEENARGSGGGGHAWQRGVGNG